MSDQAAVLRQLASERSEPRPKFFCPFFVITGGKGGVGKTSFTANVSLALAQQKKRVLMVDLDLGLANLDVFLRVHPPHHLGSVIEGKKDITECLLRVPEGITLLPGPSGLEEFAVLGVEKRQKLIQDLARVSKQFDFILADTSAGIAPDVLGFAGAADRVVLVTTPEPAALTDAYALLKLLLQKHPKLSVSFVMNAAATTEEAANAANKLRLISQHFLQYPLEYLGSIPRDSAVPRASREQRPFLSASPDSLAAGAVRHMALKIQSVFPQKS